MYRNKSFRITIAVLYLAFISVLFFLPGTAFPKATWLDKIGFDKWVHVGLFAVLLVAWCRAFPSDNIIKMLVIAAAVYGIAVEWIQHNFVANRGFDIGDWIADVVGIITGVLLYRRYIKK